jgi:hypothetical protein
LRSKILWDTGFGLISIDNLMPYININTPLIINKYDLATSVL